MSLNEDNRAKTDKFVFPMGICCQYPESLLRDSMINQVGRHGVHDTSHVLAIIAESLQDLESALRISCSCTRFRYFGPERNRPRFVASRGNVCCLLNCISDCCEFFRLSGKQC